MPSGRALWLVCVAILLSVAAEAAVTRLAGASAAPPALAVSPHGNFSNGQTISVSVGSNGFFTPHARVNILECADPGGLAANLPRDDSTCDGNSIQGSTILVSSAGSFSDPSYPVYSLPSATLGEQSNASPACDQTHYCVLYVGQNQNDFTTPKVFSAPFLVAPGSGAPAGTGPGAAASGSSSTTSSPTNASTTQAPAASVPTSASGTSGSPGGAGSGASAVADPSGTLANTGLPAETEWVVLAGLILLLGGAVGRRFVLRGTR